VKDLVVLAVDERELEPGANVTISSEILPTRFGKKATLNPNWETIGKSTEIMCT
jgi:hypothetical protein